VFRLDHSEVNLFAPVALLARRLQHTLGFAPIDVLLGGSERILFPFLGKIDHFGSQHLINSSPLVVGCNRGHIGRRWVLAMWALRANLRDHGLARGVEERARPRHFVRTFLLFLLFTLLVLLLKGVDVAIDIADGVIHLFGYLRVDEIFRDACA